MQQGQVVAPDGTVVRYHHLGEEGTALVFVHGLSCNRFHWDGQMGMFGAARRTIAIDLGGHGESSGEGRSAWTMDSFASDIATVLRVEALDRAILIGHSMGGYAIPLAARMEPERVIGLIGVDSWTALDTTSEAPSFAPFETDFAGTMEIFARSMFRDDADPALIDRITRDMCATDPGIVLEIMRNVGGDKANLLDGLTMPKWMIGSDHFSFKDPRVANAKGFTLVKMEGVGHFPMLERPDAFNAILKRAVETMEGSGEAAKSASRPSQL